jgi:hypothetical protein
MACTRVLKGYVSAAFMSARVVFFGATAAVRLTIDRPPKVLHPGLGGKGPALDKEDVSVPG